MKFEIPWLGKKARKNRALKEAKKQFYADASRIPLPRALAIHQKVKMDINIRYA